ncbi:FHA domain-containing protein, partial [Agrobacterium sp. S2]|nr:FHA domain-containing protein [Agrobacterium sp. S2]
RVRPRHPRHYTSSHHARLMLWGEQWMLQDLDSTNGTWHDGERVSAPVPIVLGAPHQGGRDDLRAAGLTGDGWSSRARARRSRTPARCDRTTRTPGTPDPTCSSWPTAWAGTPAVTWPRASRSTASRSSTARSARRARPRARCSRRSPTPPG